jgi:hypothetical protein
MEESAAGNHTISRMTLIARLGNSQLASGLTTDQSSLLGVEWPAPDVYALVPQALPVKGEM